ncbi:MAG TPA: magnesium/cobalt transporter CorA [bacterium]|nr:magnesium/cobalt transporter CorA [bacterium]
MKRLLYRKKRKADLPPGSLVYNGDTNREPPGLTVIRYNAEHWEEREVLSLEEGLDMIDSKQITWINVDGIHQPELFRPLEHRLRIHPLMFEDIMNVDQRPKLEDSDEALLIVLKMISVNSNAEDLQAEQVSLLMGKNWMITIQEKPGDVFDPIRQRIRHGKGRIRRMTVDYLLYALIDALLDGYFSAIETLGNRVETLEESILEHPDQNTMSHLQEIKRELLYIRKAAWPLREIASVLGRGESGRVSRASLPYFRTILDHTVQVVDMVETLRDMNTGLADLYLSSVSNRMNEIMKVLTIIATIFIPLTFVAGIYGMNFEFMPELKWKLGYFATLSLMGLVIVIMLWFFRKKKWL